MTGVFSLLDLFVLSLFASLSLLAAFLVYLVLALGLCYVFGWNTTPVTFFGEIATLGTILIALTYLVVAQAELGRRIPFAFLLELKKKFLAQYSPDDTEYQSLPAYGTAAFNTTLKSMLQQYNIAPPNDSLANAKKEIVMIMPTLMSAPHRLEIAHQIA